MIFWILLKTCVLESNIRTLVSIYDKNKETLCKYQMIYNVSWSWYILQILGSKSNWFFISTQILLNDDFRFVLSEHEYYVYLHLIYDSDL